jgi:2-phosphosulfolactate phosphatase
MPTLDLYLLPKDAPPERLADATVIVIDLLRASTTICRALAAGAECVMPFAEIDETLAAAQAFGRDNVLLGGERHGKLIPGFDLGNSPAEYTPTIVAGRRILFSTTNGARALHHARSAQRVLVGAAVNRTAVARAVQPGANVVILCAGTDGEVAREDELAGGAIIEAIRRGGATWELNEPANAARHAWRTIVDGAEVEQVPVVHYFARRLGDTQGGRNLLDIGHDADLPACAQLDTLTIVPELNRTTGELRPA